MRTKKPIYVLTLILAVVLLSAAVGTSASHVTWNYGVGYVDTHRDFVPYKGSAGFSVGGTSAGRVLMFNSRMTFNQTVVNAISNHMNNRRFFTWDVSNINDNDTTINATGWYATTLPNPKFDRDDDPWPFGNGFFDETEVVALELVVANVEYNFFAAFADRRNGTSGGTVEARAQLSSWSLFFREYNAVDSSTVAQGRLTYGPNPGRY